MAVYISHINKTIYIYLRKIISITVLIAFVTSSVKNPAYAQVSSDFMSRLPAPGTMVHLSPEFTPAHLKGIIIHPEDPLKFDFIVYKGDQVLSNQEKNSEYTKLIKYFLAALAVPDDDQWVNLSPYEKNRIIKDDFGKTEMGRDLLAQDYMLKQVTASLIYPQDKLGQEFWNKVYAKAYQQFGTTNIPVNTFNKVWIVPDDAQVIEKGSLAYVVKNHLKVMLEEDYLSLGKHTVSLRPIGPLEGGTNEVSDEAILKGTTNAKKIASLRPSDFVRNDTHNLASQIVREVVLPALEREVNEGKNFAPLRQVFSGVVLAAWYKLAMKESFLAKIYMNKSRLKGVDQDPKNNQLVYQQYLKAFKKGVFNFIKEDVDKYSNETIPRKYFSGGIETNLRTEYGDKLHVGPASRAQLADAAMNTAKEDLVRGMFTDAAMTQPVVKKREIDLSGDRDVYGLIERMIKASYQPNTIVKGKFNGIPLELTGDENLPDDRAKRQYLDRQFDIRRGANPDIDMQSEPDIKLGGSLGEAWNRKYNQYITSKQAVQARGYLDAQYGTSRKEKYISNCVLELFLTLLGSGVKNGRSHSYEGARVFYVVAKVNPEKLLDSGIALMRSSGLYNTKFGDSLPNQVIELLKVIDSQDHSGESFKTTLDRFLEIANAYYTNTDSDLEVQRALGSMGKAALASGTDLNAAGRTLRISDGGLTRDRAMPADLSPNGLKLSITKGPGIHVLLDVEHGQNTAESPGGKDIEPRVRIPDAVKTGDPAMESDISSLLKKENGLLQQAGISISFDKLPENIKSAVRELRGMVEFDPLQLLHPYWSQPSDEEREISKIEEALMYSDQSLERDSYIRDLFVLAMGLKIKHEQWKGDERFTRLYSKIQHYLSPLIQKEAESTLNSSEIKSLGYNFMGGNSHADLHNRHEFELNAGKKTIDRLKDELNVEDEVLEQLGISLSQRQGVYEIRQRVDQLSYEVDFEVQMREYVKKNNIVLNNPLGVQPMSAVKAVEAINQGGQLKTILKDARLEFDAKNEGSVLVYTKNTKVLYDARDQLLGVYEGNGSSHIEISNVTSVRIEKDKLVVTSAGRTFRISEGGLTRDAAMNSKKSKTPIRSALFSKYKSPQRVMKMLGFAQESVRLIVGEKERETTVEKLLERIHAMDFKFLLIHKDDQVVWKEMRKLSDDEFQDRWRKMALKKQRQKVERNHLFGSPADINELLDMMANKGKQNDRWSQFTRNLSNAYMCFNMSRSGEIEGLSKEEFQLLQESLMMVFEFWRRWYDAGMVSDAAMKTPATAKVPSGTFGISDAGLTRDAAMTRFIVKTVFKIVRALLKPFSTSHKLPTDISIKGRWLSEIIDHENIAIEDRAIELVSRDQHFRPEPEGDFEKQLLEFIVQEMGVSDDVSREIRSYLDVRLDRDYQKNLG